MKISVAQALLILLDKYKDSDPEKFNELKLLYLVGADCDAKLARIEHYLADDVLSDYVVSREKIVINEDPTRRYFESHLARLSLPAYLDRCDLADLTDHADKLVASLPYAHRQIVQHVMDGRVDLVEPHEREYIHLFTQIREGSAFSTLSAEQTLKLTHVVRAVLAAVHMVVSTNELPLAIYGKGIYSGRERGVDYKGKQDSARSCSRGIMKGHMPLFGDAALSESKIGDYSRAADGGRFVPGAKWVEDNFKRLVHPFSNSISGTVLCQLRTMLARRQKDEKVDRIDSAIDKMKPFFGAMINVLLFSTGGHAMHEYVAPLELPVVRESYNDVPGFADLNLKALMLDDNGPAYQSAVEMAIAYNKRYLASQKMQQELILRRILSVVGATHIYQPLLKKMSMTKLNKITSLPNEGIVRLFAQSQEVFSKLCGLSRGRLSKYIVLSDPALAFWLGAPDKLQLKCAELSAVQLQIIADLPKAQREKLLVYGVRFIGRILMQPAGLRNNLLQCSGKLLSRLTWSYTETIPKVAELAPAYHAQLEKMSWQELNELSGLSVERMALVLSLVKLLDQYIDELAKNPVSVSRFSVFSHAAENQRQMGAALKIMKEAAVARRIDRVAEIASKEIYDHLKKPSARIKCMLRQLEGSALVIERYDTPAATVLSG